MKQLVNPRETAQWFACGGYDTARVSEAIAALPEATRKACRQYGSLLTFNRLPLEAQLAIESVRLSVQAEGDRLQAEIDEQAKRITAEQNDKANETL
jgi:hypothetical protein